MNINLNKVKDFDVSFIENWYPTEYNLFKINQPTTQNNGVLFGEHYKLLSYFSSLYKDSSIIDGGTSTGISALALGNNKKNVIKSYDLINVNPPYRSQFNNINFYCKNLLQEDKSVLLNSPLILLDLDPHDGIQESEFFQILRNINYKGLVILDDISTSITHGKFSGMLSFWNSIIEPKWDLSIYGHASGTGLVSFGIDVDITY